MERARRGARRPRGCDRTGHAPGTPESRRRRRTARSRSPSSRAAVRRRRRGTEDAPPPPPRGRGAQGSPSGIPPRSRSRGLSPSRKAGAPPSSRRRCTAGRSSAPPRWGEVRPRRQAGGIPPGRTGAAAHPPLRKGPLRRGFRDGGSVPPPCGGGGSVRLPGPFPQRPQAGVVRQGQMDRGGGNESILDRLEVGARDVLAVQVVAADPVILPPPRVAFLDDHVAVDALPHPGDPRSMPSRAPPAAPAAAVSNRNRLRVTRETAMEGTPSSVPSIAAETVP